MRQFLPWFGSLWSCFPCLNPQLWLWSQTVTTPQSLALSWSPLCWFHQVEHRGSLQLQILSIVEIQVYLTIKTVHVLGFNSYLKKLKRRYSKSDLFFFFQKKLLLHENTNKYELIIQKISYFKSLIKADLCAIQIFCWELSQHLTNWAVFFYKVGTKADVKRRLINIGDIDDKHLRDLKSWSTMSIVYTFNLLRIKVPRKQLLSWGIIIWDVNKVSFSIQVYTSDK